MLNIIGGVFILEKIEEKLDVSQMKKVLYTKGRIYYEGQILANYGLHNYFIERIIINKFVIHYDKKTKEPYINFNFSREGHKQKMTFDIEWFNKYTKNL